MTAPTIFDSTVPLRRPTVADGLRRIRQALVRRVRAELEIRRTRRALMAMSSWQRVDCGLDGLDIRSACEMEAAARRRLELRMPSDWS